MRSMVSSSVRIFGCGRRMGTVSSVVAPPFQRMSTSARGSELSRWRVRVASSSKVRSSCLRSLSVVVGAVQTASRSSASASTAVRSGAVRAAGRRRGAADAELGGDLLGDRTVLDPRGGRSAGGRVELCRPPFGRGRGFLGRAGACGALQHLDRYQEDVALGEVVDQVQGLADVRPRRSRVSPLIRSQGRAKPSRAVRPSCPCSRRCACRRRCASRRLRRREARRSAGRGFERWH
jgi:hypothetical protein